MNVRSVPAHGGVAETTSINHAKSIYPRGTAENQWFQYATRAGIPTVHPRILYGIALLGAVWRQHLNLGLAPTCRTVRSPRTYPVQIELEELMRIFRFLSLAILSVLLGSIDGEYFQFDVLHPGVRIALFVVM